MQLGGFSVSLTVKDIKVSKAFYEKLGFTQFAGDIEHKYLIMQNGTTNIGLFEGMFDKNILTFNPGWDFDASELAEFTDVRELQKTIKDSGIKLETEADASGKGPASITIIDPDGNPILLDQHR